jgi:hypothetical protein
MQTKTKPQYRDYPEAVATRTGCKVGWRVYTTIETAAQCAEAARHNARIQESLGYDFGYQSPGNITQLEDGRFEVCIP